MGNFEPKGQGGRVGSETPIECYHGELGDNDGSFRKRDHA